MILALIAATAAPYLHTSMPHSMLGSQGVGEETCNVKPNPYCGAGVGIPTMPACEDMNPMCVAIAVRDYTLATQAAIDKACDTYNAALQAYAGCNDPLSAQLSTCLGSIVFNNPTLVAICWDNYHTANMDCCILYWDGIDGVDSTYWQERAAAEAAFHAAIEECCR